MAYAFNDDKSKFDLDTLAGNMATIEVSPTVDNHYTGEYILYDNILYEVISPIAAGESLVLGTNVRSINIGDQLKDLQDSVSPYTIDLTTMTSAMTFPAGVSLFTSIPNTVTVIGRIVLLKFSIKIENATTGMKGIMNYIPEGLRPSSVIEMSSETSFGDGKNQPVVLYSNGSINFWPVNTGMTTYAIGSGVYVM